MRLEERRDERPAAGARRRPEPREATRSGPAARRGTLRRAPGHPQRAERVVGDLTGPHEVPERAEHHGLVGGARRGDELRPERRARARESLPQRVVHRARRPLVGRGHRGGQQAHRVAEVQADPPVVRAERARAHPDELAGGAQLVEHRRSVPLDARGQHVTLEHRRGDGDALELLDRVDERVESAPGRADALPRGQEPRERGRVDRLDLVAHRRERPAAQCAQHVHVAPLALHPAGPELAEHDAALALESSQRLVRSLGRDAEPPGQLVGRERPVRAGEARGEVVERTLDGIGEGDRQAGRDREPQRVPQAGGVLGRRVAVADAR
ncbi:MAG: hypothetical protein KatS3mg010_1058 [Acidimicrobiia bacterium]|nr:MAG: hypothetical protein KatS3mg010_1058 [Acidimicrobiia bacterium]